jgi:hypothetical protein
MQMPCNSLLLVDPFPLHSILPHALAYPHAYFADSILPRALAYHHAYFADAKRLPLLSRLPYRKNKIGNLQEQR